ncbi:MAG TPA: FeoB-associated Cys-rich membrane protein [Dongiaceae bacterium]|nr:FeoB-associated Cys-rich membrane protein [Dongiaceae bacterium]
MGISDMFIAAVILGGAFWLLYHSLWKKKGHCQGGCSGSCGKK